MIHFSMDIVEALWDGHASESLARLLGPVLLAHVGVAGIVRVL